MTKHEAYETVRSTFDDDNMDDSDLMEIFEAIFDRQPDENEIGIEWSLCCSATPGLCGCSTRTEHENGACA